jgi:hypothetical protein
LNAGAITQFALEYWELVFLIVIPGAWKLAMMYKRKLLDEVYATKEELRTSIELVRDDVHQTITEHAKEDYQFQRELNEKMDENHNEIKDLIIKYLGGH